MTLVPPEPRVIVTHAPCAWLPAGGRAEIVLSRLWDTPQPVAVVRLLATCAGAVLGVARPDGRGLDIPTSTTIDGVGATLTRLVTEFVPDLAGAPQPLGYVRNVVPHPSEDYPWPTPHAHFAVWHLRGAARQSCRGRWLEPDDAAAELGQRHWWPLVGHLGQEDADA